MNRRPLLEVIGDWVWLATGVAALAGFGVVVVEMIWRPWA